MHGFFQLQIDIYICNIKFYSSIFLHRDDLPYIYIYLYKARLMSSEVNDDSCPQRVQTI